MSECGGEPRRRQRRALAHRRDRRHPRRPARRQDARQQRDRRVPSASETMTVRGANTVAASGRSTPERGEQGDHALGDPDAGEEPDQRRQQADHQALGDDRAHDLLARGAERPQRRELARALGDRDRQGVEDHERADEQCDAAEAEQEVCGRSPMPPSVSSASVVGLLRAVLDLEARRAPAAARRGRARPARCRPWRRSRCRRSGPLVQQRLRGREVPGRDAWRRRASRRSPKRGDAGDRVAALGAERGDGDRVADAVVLLGGGAGVDRRPASAPCAHCAGLELQRAELRLGGVDSRAPTRLRGAEPTCRRGR